MSNQNHNMPDLSRRALLRNSGMGLGMLSLGGLLARDGVAAPAPSPFTPRPPHFQPKAKHVIHIFLNGGCPQMDSFDPKPLLNKYDGKPLPVRGLTTENMTGNAFGSPFKFRKHGESGIEVSELFKNIGRVIDDVCVIRSMHTSSPTHTPCLMMMNSGSLVQHTPAMGSWLSYGLGSENQELPGFVVLCPDGLPIAGKQNWRSAFLPSIHQGTYILTSGKKPEQLIDNVQNKYLGQQTQRRQLDFLQAANRQHLEQRGHDQALESRIQSYEMAYRMQSAATDAFDIRQEPGYIHKMYGSSDQAKQMIMARRLVERGVRTVQLWHGQNQPWDLHTKLDSGMRFLAGQCDQPIAALITDLKQRGLLDETIVMWSGEFGRTPTRELSSSGSPTSGRDHNHYGFTVCMAGGGFKGGLAYGATDDFGFRAIENRMHVHDLHATVLNQLGLDHTKLTYRHAGRDFRLTDVHGRVVHDILA